MSPTDTAGAGSSPTGTRFTDAFSGPIGRRRLRTITLSHQTGETPMAVTSNTKNASAAAADTSANTAANDNGTNAMNEQDTDALLQELREAFMQLAIQYKAVKAAGNTKRTKLMLQAIRAQVNGILTMTDVNVVEALINESTPDSLLEMFADIKATESTTVRVLKTVGKVALVGSGVGLIGGAAYYGYKRFFAGTAPVVEVTVAE